jgi:hypothetical protein
MGSKIEQTVALLSEIDAGAFEGDEAARARTITAARKLLRRLESPMDRCYKLMGETWTWGIIQALKDIGLWEAWAKDGGEKSLEELRGLANTDVDINLLRA